MNTTQRFAAALIGVLAVGTIVLMPLQPQSRATPGDRAVGQTGSIVVVSQVAPELPQDQVRDLTY
jgi:hypothetical protein